MCRLQPPQQWLAMAACHQTRPLQCDTATTSTCTVSWSERARPGTLQLVQHHGRIDDHDDEDYFNHQPVDHRYFGRLRRDFIVIVALEVWIAGIKEHCGTALSPLLQYRCLPDRGKRRFGPDDVATDEREK